MILGPQHPPPWVPLANHLVYLELRESPGRGGHTNAHTGMIFRPRKSPGFIMTPDLTQC